MARAYSQDLRERVLEATTKGMSARQAAERFGVGVSTAIVWVRRARVDGERSARRQGQAKGSKLDAQRDYLLGLVEASTDITLKEMQARLREEKGVAAGIGTLWRFFRGQDCLIPAFDDALFTPEWREALWARYSMEAPQRQRRSVERYSIVKRA